MAEKDIEIVAAGHLCLDIIPRIPGAAGPLSDLLVPGKLVNVEEAALSTGGAVSNTGLALAKLGVRPMLMAGIGQDDFGELVRRRVAALADDRGIKAIPGASTSYTVVIAPPGADRIFLHCPGANDKFGLEHIDFTLFERARIVHLGYPPIMRRMFTAGGVELVEIFRRAKLAGAVTSLDMSLPDPNSESGQVDWMAIYRQLLPYVDLFHPSVEEALFTSDRAEWQRLKAEPDGAIDNLGGAVFSGLAERFLAMGAGLVTIKAGRRGIYARSADAARLRGLAELAAAPAAPIRLAEWAERELWSPSYPAPAGGSATGAGDAALAGFLASLLRGHSLAGALDRANATAWQNLRSLDALSGIENWARSEALAGDCASARNDLESPGPGWRFDSVSRHWLGPANRS